VPGVRSTTGSDTVLRASVISNLRCSLLISQFSNVGSIDGNVDGMSVGAIEGITVGSELGHDDGSPLG